MLVISFLWTTCSIDIIQLFFNVIPHSLLGFLYRTVFGFLWATCSVYMLQRLFNGAKLQELPLGVILAVLCRILLQIPKTHS